MVAIMMTVTKKVAGLSGNFFVKQQKALGEANGFIEEMMDGQKVVKVFCHEEENIKKFKELNDNLCDSSYNANAFANILGPINASLGNDKLCGLCYRRRYSGPEQRGRLYSGWTGQLPDLQ